MARSLWLLGGGLLLAGRLCHCRKNDKRGQKQQAQKRSHHLYHQRYLGVSLCGEESREHTASDVRLSIVRPATVSVMLSEANRPVVPSEAMNSVIPGEATKLNAVLHISRLVKLFKQNLLRRA